MPEAFTGIGSALAAMYLLLCIWCSYKFVQLSAASSLFSSQKFLHLALALATAIRAATFIALMNDATAYFYVQISSETASTWLYVGDELPSLLVCMVIATLVHTWAFSYHQAMQSVAWYRKVSLRGALSAFAVVVALQLGLWIAYEQVRENRHIIAVIEGAMYALVYALLAAGMILYGTRASRIYQTIAGATLTVRLRSSGNVFFQATTAGVALTLRAFVGLAAAIGAAFFWDSDDESTSLGVACTFLAFLLLEVLPLCVILRQNRHTAGPSPVPAPSVLVNRICAILNHWIRCRCCARRSRRSLAAQEHLDMHAADALTFSSATPPVRSPSAVVVPFSGPDAYSTVKGSEEANLPLLHSP